MLHPVSSLTGYGIEAVDGSVGSVRDFLFDDARWTVRWAVVDTGSWLTGRQVLLAPEALGAPDGRRRIIPVDLTRERVEKSPPLSHDAPVSRQAQGGLYAYYGWAPYWGPPGAFPMAPAGGLGAAAAPLTPEAPLQASFPENDGDPHLHSTGEVTGYAIAARDGELGHVEDFLLDDASWALRYLVVDTRNWWPGKKALVATSWLGEVSWSAREVAVGLTRQEIKDSPEYDPAQPVERSYEERLWAHHGQPGYWT